jgi:hypothetical protein
MVGEHAILAPSSFHITVECPGHIKNASLVPALPDSEEAKEGDAAHWVALMMGNGASVLVGTKAPNGVAITDEMIDAGHLWVEACEGHPAMAETRVQIERVHETECWGTPDRFGWNPATKILRVMDYKFGFLPVEVWENWQLILYAAGIMELLRLSDLDVVLELVIVQPRAYHPDGPIRSWTVGATKLRTMINAANHAGHEALSDNPHTHSGPHCLHCPARVSCTTLQKTVGNVMDFRGHADPTMQTAGDVGRELRLVMDARQRLKARQTGLEAQAEAMLRAGQRVPFFAMEPGQSRLKWLEDVTPAEVEALAQMKGKSALKPPALLTPTQVIKGKILDAAVMSAYSERPPGAMKMVLDSTTKASRIFEQ